MNGMDELSRIRGLSDGDVLQGLSGALRASRGAMAGVIAFLGEVEERRLHLLVGCESMFAYCLARLHMSEDEACRRIDVARLARRFPLLLDRLAGGAISLSVAALLKPHLNDTNQLRLADAVSGKTVQQAREVLVAWFPKPDVVASIRKLPPGVSRTVMASGPAAAPEELVDRGAVAELEPAAPPSPCSSTAISSGRRSAPRSIEPLSPERYKVQLTAGRELKQKIELARDLLRHAIPSGDLAAIVGRALDLLIEQTTKRRFGAKPREMGTSATTSSTSSVAPSTPTTATNEIQLEHRADGSSPVASTSPDSTSPDPTSPDSTPANATPANHRAHIPLAVRRAVLERDGMRCTWQGPDGVRCEGRAWLELDHIVPRGQGGGHDPANIRVRCRLHNRLAAEQAYGQQVITQIIDRHQARRHPASAT